MKKNSYSNDAKMKDKLKKMSVGFSETGYANAMKVYKTFAYTSGVLLTAVYIIAQVI